MSDMKRTTRVGITAIALFSLTVLQLSAARGGEVADRAEFFSTTAVHKASDDIRAIKDLYQRDVVISSFPSVMPYQMKFFRELDKEKRNTFFASWTKDRMRLEEVSGVYILICKDPPHIQVSAGSQFQSPVVIMTGEDQDKLRDLLVKHFHDAGFVSRAAAVASLLPETLCLGGVLAFAAQDRYDRGLIDAVKFVRERLDEHASQIFPGPVAREVKDYASFFSPTAVAKANDEIKTISQKLKRPIAVDTFKRPPASIARQAQLGNEEQRRRLYDRWIMDRSRASRFDGIYILVTKEPARLEIRIDPAVERKAFKPADRRALQNLLLAKFREQHFDEGLADALSLIRDRVRANLGTASAAPVAPVKPLMEPVKTDLTKTDVTAADEAN
jgi:hypothetical protein